MGQLHVHLGSHGHDGDGIRMASEAGMGAPSHLMMCCLNLTVEPLGVSSQLAAAGSQEPTNMWVNQDAVRFVDESVTSYMIFSNNAIENQIATYSALDQACFDRLVNEGCVNGWGFYVRPGSKLTEAPAELEKVLKNGNPNVFVADTLPELAKKMGLDSATFEKTVSDYNAMVDAGEDMQYGKAPQFLVPIRTSPFYGFRVKGCIVNGMGGIRINTKCEVITETGKVISGLYAAGMDCGGFSGETYGLAVPGSCQGISLSTGRLSGLNAASYAKKA
ncbi:MAG: FAD-binding protein [Coriobacteriia bacterium]